MVRRGFVRFIVALAGAAAVPAGATAAPVLLPSGRVLTPAGTLTSAGDYPAAAVPAAGRVYVADAGTTPNELLTVDPSTGAAVGRPLLAAPSTSEAPYALSGGLAVSADGATVWAAGGATGVVHRVATATGLPGADVPVGGFAADVAVSADGTRLFVTEPFDPSGPLGKGATVAVAPTSGAGPITRVRVGSQPLAVLDMTVAGRELLAVANRDAATVSVLDARTLTSVATVPVGRQPAALAATPGGGRLLVADSLDDRLDVVDTGRWTVIGSTRLGRRPGLGAGPGSIALAPDGATAYVTLGADNAVAVIRRSPRGAWTEIGEIPTAADPTSVTVGPAGRSLTVTAGKGLGATAALPPGAPLLVAQPLDPGPTGFGVAGAIERIAVPDAVGLAADTRRVERNNDPCGCARSHRLPPGLRAIRHVVYVIRENKTFDEELGDEPGGAPAGLLYGRRITPDTHALAERFALMQSFFADEEVSDTGHQVVMGAVANDWVQRFSQQAYGLDGAPRQGAELGNDASTLWSPGDYLLDAALAHGVSFRDDGEFYRRNQSPGPRFDQAVSAALEAHVDHGFPHPGFDPNYPDTGRIAYWIRAHAGELRTGSLPQLDVIYLPEDHTSMGLPPAPLPQQQVADADLATGRLVEALSHSPAWGATALFLTEDDPQSGIDHVDAHRTVGLVVSPHVHAGAVATRFDQAGMLRTVEEILGLPPLTELDATARPMDSVFSAAADLRPFTAITPHPPALSPAAVSRLRTAARAAVGPVASPAALSQIPPAVQQRLSALAAGR